jgi:ABC-2 type transport system ATP-binding protein
VRILSTLTRADAGSARVAGFDVVRERHRVRRSISLTGQYAAVDDLQTGEENLRMMARLSGLPAAAARRQARELLERFDPDRPPRPTRARQGDRRCLKPPPSRDRSAGRTPPWSTR